MFDHAYYIVQPNYRDYDTVAFGPAPFTADLRKKGIFPAKRSKQLTLEEAKKGTESKLIELANHNYYYAIDSTSMQNL